jgi:hypothetical protein
MSRRCSFRVELGGLLPEARSLEFESGLVVQFSGVSPEINQPALPSAEAPGEAAQSALTTGPLAREQATIHAVADALQSRGSATADGLADQIPRGWPCDNQQTERVEGPAHRRDSALLNKASLTKIPGLELRQRERRNRQARHIRHHTLEPHSFRCRLQKQRAGNQCGTRRALPHLLAADFCFHLPTWLFDSGRRGPHAGFLCDDTER